MCLPEQRKDICGWLQPIWCLTQQFQSERASSIYLTGQGRMTSNWPLPHFFSFVCIFASIKPLIYIPIVYAVGFLVIFERKLGELKPLVNSSHMFLKRRLLTNPQWHLRDYISLFLLPKCWKITLHQLNNFIWTNVSFSSDIHSHM